MDRPEVIVVGLGYVGLTLAAALADQGCRVWGYERQPQVVAQLQSGRSHLYEPGLEDILKATVGSNLTVATHLPDRFRGVVVICVSTPVGSDQTPDFQNLQSAAEAVSRIVEDGALVIVRSTVGVGTTRKLVLPVLREHGRKVYLAFAPERTIQGRALQELRELPQVVGGVDQDSTDLAAEFFTQLTTTVVRVSSLEAAEMVKLVNNSHTDVLYSFGNEIAMMAQRLGLDPLEVIGAANLEYPRPDLARPGFVAGPCLTKDPYLLISAMRDHGYTPELVAAPRRLNESLPATVAHHFLQSLAAARSVVDRHRVLICGFAYKGYPVTDDLRGTPVGPLLDVLGNCDLELLGHDYMVGPEAIARFGVTPVANVAEGMAGAHGVILMNEHPAYRKLDMAELAKAMERPAVIYDCWRLYDPREVEAIPGVHYKSIGYDQGAET